MEEASIYEKFRNGGGTHIGKGANCLNPSGNKGNIRICKMCDIDAVLVTQDNGKIVVGDFTTIRYDSIVGSLEQIEIGSHCMISNRVTIYDNNNHPTDAKTREKMCESGFTSELWKWRYSLIVLSRLAIMFGLEKNRQS